LNAIKQTFVLIGAVLIGTLGLVAGFYGLMPQQMRLVGAYYYFWDYSISSWEFSPIPSLANGALEQTMNLSLQLAHQSSIDFFVLSYWSFAGYDTPTQKMFEIDSKLGNPMKLSILIEYYNGTNGHCRVDLNEFADHIWQLYAQQPAYLKWEGKPLLLIYTQKYMPPPWLDPRFTVRYVSIQVPYSTATNVKIDAFLYKEFQGVFPGFNNLAGGTPDKLLIPRQEGRFYRAQWQQAITISRTSQTSTCVMVTSWNEFPEQTAIAPTLQAGNLYLNITRECAQQYKSGQP
jgi:hypothetical protein